MPSSDRAITGKPPQEGSVCWCYFPEVPGAAVKHPCLVLSVLQDQNQAYKLVIALGESAVKNGVARKVYPGEIVFLANDPDLHVKPIDGVAFNVKFSLRPQHVMVANYNRDCFYVAHGQVWPKIGSVDLKPGTKAHAQMENAMEVANLRSTIESLKASVVPSPSSTVDTISTAPCTDNTVIPDAGASAADI